ncbi:sensor histidine kinase [Xanthobacter versatilis]|uniref:sensor histidine kinase n=1 Tax=Xanthobacter autotrophicus (strain ATCC BAA-1158 / Py2) TaxID=78245 RepID=UPI00372A6B47
MRRRIFAFRSIAVLVLVWIGAVGGFALLSVRSATQQAGEELNAAGVALHRIVSQRVAQHDAHLTSLAALVQSADPPPREAVRQVALAIMRFYPRIVSVRIVAPGAGGGGEILVAAPDGMMATPLPAFTAGVFAQAPGEARAYAEPAVPRRYFLGKRTGGPGRPLAMIVEIDPALLVEGEERPAATRLRLDLGGHSLVDRTATAGPQGSATLETLHFERAIDSQTQPLKLALDRGLAFAQVVPMGPVLLFAVLSLIGLLALRYTLKQRREASRSRAAAREAQERSLLLERETRLAHASRVNALGELASGIAHELTQPLTALLSQSQAALRLAVPGGDAVRLDEALRANVREAKRAGEMLQRMRDYISNRATSRMPSDINAVIVDASALARTDLAQRGIGLELDLDRTLPQAVVDPIELEQVLHNLIRNAVDSLDGTAQPEKTIVIRTGTGGGQVEIRVADTGPGIAPAVLPRLFEPFFTTKADGMGLGLSLCATLVERAGGSIRVDAGATTGAAFVIILPAAVARMEAAQ